MAVPVTAARALRGPAAGAATSASATDSGAATRSAVSPRGRGAKEASRTAPQIAHRMRLATARGALDQESRAAAAAGPAVTTSDAQARGWSRTSRGASQEARTVAPILPTVVLCPSAPGAPVADVRLVDLEVLKRFSLVLRREFADAEDVLPPPHTNPRPVLAAPRPPGAATAPAPPPPHGLANGQAQ